MTTVQDARVTQILSHVVNGRALDADLPARLCAECRLALPVSGVALALMSDDGPSGAVLAATDEQARQLEELQFALDEGPCVEASSTGGPVLHPELTATGSARWPRYGAAALDAGVHAIFAFPLRVGAIRLGVLDLYRDVPGHLSTLELADALAFADAATVLLLYLQGHPDPDGERSALTGPIDRRAEIHQATGMITIQLGVSLTEALLRLRAHAYDSGQTVIDVAAEVVSRRLRFDDSEFTSESDGPKADR
jgi:GAF domain-containing protein/ANTAR domain-containing protein